MPELFRVILLVETSRGFGRDLLTGVAEYSRLHGPWTFYRMPAFYLDPTSKQRDAELHRMKRWGANGIILREVPNMDDILAMRLPTIVSTYLNPEVPTGAHEIYVDNVGVGRMAAEHLIERSFQHFAFCGLDDFFWSQQRAEGFCGVIEEAGYSVCRYPQPRSPGGRLWDAEQKKLAAWLRELPKPVGLMACIDERAQHVLEACKVADMMVPDEVAIVSGDNDELICNLSNPPLSSVAVGGFEAGYQAAKLLDRLMRHKLDGKQRQVVRVEPKYVATRTSTDILAINDLEVARAVRYIHGHAREPLQVPDVARSVGLTRHTLEARFRKALGRSVHDEITGVRIDRICRLLLDTEMSVTEIAMEMGFTDVHHIARYFRRKKDMSPLAFRKRHRG